MNETVAEKLNAISREHSWTASNGSQISCKLVDAGKINLPSGKVCIADPYMIDPEEHTIRHKFDPGEYSIRLCVASITSEDLNDSRVASAMMIVNDNEIKFWTPAEYDGVEPEDDLEEDEEDESRGYGVDLATSCFVSPEALSELAEDEDFERLSDDLTKAITAAEENNKFSCEIQLNGQRMIAFPSGFGDGFYFNWVGIDANKQPCVLITAFDVLE